jgi:hypothetical protein
MQGERILIPMYRNESDHTGPTGRATAPSWGRPALDQPRPAALGHAPGTAAV